MSDDERESRDRRRDDEEELDEDEEIDEDEEERDDEEDDEEDEEEEEDDEEEGGGVSWRIICTFLVDFYLCDPCSVHESDNESRKPQILSSRQKLLLIPTRKTRKRMKKDMAWIGVRNIVSLQFPQGIFT